MRLLYVFLFFIASGSVFSQSETLAENYFDRVEYQKAISIYQKLYAKMPYKSQYMLKLVEAHQQLENFDLAQTLLEKKLQTRNAQSEYLVDLGHNYALQKKDSLANTYYNQALELLAQKPNYSSLISRKFEQFSLLDKAIMAYEKAM